MVIIPEICITQVSGICRNFAADMKKIVLSIIMLAMTTTFSDAQNVQNKAAENSTLQLVSERSGKCLFFYLDFTFLR